jgi:hypothetical protein
MQRESRPPGPASGVRAHLLDATRTSRGDKRKPPSARRSRHGVPPQRLRSFASRHGCIASLPQGAVRPATMCRVVAAVRCTRTSRGDKQHTPAPTTPAPGVSRRRHWTCALRHGVTCRGPWSFLSRNWRITPRCDSVVRLRLASSGPLAHAPRRGSRFVL